jgi:hypothetical protein
MSPATAGPAPTTTVRSTNHRQLNDTHTQKVCDLLAERAVACPRCQSRDFTVGDALEMGSIWPNEKLGTYMIALTCRHCDTRSGIRLHQTQFLVS